MKTRQLGICAAIVCLMAAGAVMAENGAETGGGAVCLPEPFGKVQMGMTLKEVRKALPKAKTRFVAARKEYVAGPDGRRDMLMVSVPTPPAKGKDSPHDAEAYTDADRIWESAHLNFADGRLVSASLWSSHPRPDSLFVDCEHNVTPASESPFATPLTEAESALATGRDTAAARDALLPPDYGLRLDMGRFRACLARPGLLHCDGESNDEGDSIVRYGSRLPERKGLGDILAAFENGRLVWIDMNWSYDDGWTADNPGMIRKVLDDTIRRLGPPTKRWTKEVGKYVGDGKFAPPDPVDDTWHVWHWTRGDEDVIIEIRRSLDARRTLRASFRAGVLRRLKPDALEFGEE